MRHQLLVCIILVLHTMHMVPAYCCVVLWVSSSLSGIVGFALHSNLLAEWLSSRRDGVSHVLFWVAIHNICRWQYMEQLDSHCCSHALHDVDNTKLHHACWLFPTFRMSQQFCFLVVEMLSWLKQMLALLPWCDNFVAPLPECGMCMMHAASLASRCPRSADHPCC